MFWKIIFIIIGFLFLSGLYKKKDGDKGFYMNRHYPVSTIPNLEAAIGENLIFKGSHYTEINPENNQGYNRLEGFFVMNPNSKELQFLEESPYAKLLSYYAINHGTYGGYNMCRSLRLPGGYLRSSHYNVRRKEPLQLLEGKEDGLLIELYYPDGKYDQYAFENMPYYFSNVALSPDNTTFFIHALEWGDKDSTGAKLRTNRFYVFTETEKGKTGNLTKVYSDETPSLKSYDNFQFSLDGKGIYFTRSNQIFYFDLEQKQIKEFLTLPHERGIGYLKISPTGQFAFNTSYTKGNVGIIDPQHPEKITIIKSSKFLDGKVSNFLWSPDGKQIALQVIKSKKDIIEGVDWSKSSSWIVENRSLFIYDLETQEVTEIYTKHINPELIAWVQK